jgi:hypothetical protein
MKFKTLEPYEFKDKYFYRICKWDWLTTDMIHVFDNNRPRFITMDYWPQKIYLEAKGQSTVSEFIHLIASKYPNTQIPRNLDSAIIEELEGLINEKLIELSDSPIQLDNSILNPLTEEGDIDMLGTWKGTYTYDIPEEYRDERTQKVEFEIVINSVNKNQFIGTVEDNLSTGGTPGIGNINGSFNDYELLFEKNMPIHARIENDGSHTIDENKKHPTIIYSGEFSRSKKIIKGTWRFKKKVLVWKGIIPLWILPGTGTFSMEKEKNNA